MATPTNFYGAGAALSSGELLKDLKAWFRDKVENLMWKNSDFLKMISKMRVEGKEQRFPAIIGRGGAVAARFKIANKVAADTVKLAEWRIYPGRLFDMFLMNTGDMLSAKSNKGAYMRIAGLKMFCATEAFRKTMALALYGSGFGELCDYKEPTGASASTASFVASLPQYAVIKLSIGSRIFFKTKIQGSDAQEDTTTTNVCTVTQIGSVSNTGYIDVTLTPEAAMSRTQNTVYVLSLLGSSAYYASGASKQEYAGLPVGLGGWLPIAGGRANPNTSSSDIYPLIHNDFYGVVRYDDIDGFCGNYYEHATTFADAEVVKAKGAQTMHKYEVVLEVLRMCRNKGAKTDVIIMNDLDFADLQKEIAPYNFIDASTKVKKVDNFGAESATFAFRTTWVDKVIPDPYCPKNVFYCLDSSTVEFWSYTGDNKIQDGVAPEATGKADPMSENGDNTADNNYKLLIDDYITVDQGDDDDNGPTARVTLQCMGTFVVTNTSVNGVGVFADWNESDTSNSATAEPEKAPIGYNNVAVTV